MLVSDLLSKPAQEHPDRPAVWFKGEWRTYHDLWQQAVKVAMLLRSLGVQPGDRVALFMENSFNYIGAHFGIMQAGAVEVSLNTEFRAEGIRDVLGDCGARILIAGTKHQTVWKEVASRFPQLRNIITDHELDYECSPKGDQATYSTSRTDAAPSPNGPLPDREENDLASIVYTSGVTGTPKGVMLSHRNLLSNAQSIVQYLALQSRDRMMVVLPFYYIYGRSLLYSHFLTGGSLVIDNRFAFPSVVLNTMRDLEVTAFAGVPSTYSILLHKTDVRTRRFPSLRLVTQAGGGMTPALQKEVVKTFHPARLFVMYGATEASPRLTYVAPEMLPQKWGSIGRAVPGVEVIVADPEARQLPPNVIGEIAARGPNIMLGYWNDPEATAKVLRHGYYFTGDLGYADRDGYVYLTGRTRDLIKTGGQRVSAKEIEDAIADVPGVLETAVIGVPDDILGEAIKAYVVPDHPNITEETLRRALGNHLPHFKLPKSVEFRKSLPKTQSGKILKSQLYSTT
jgi:long-chain acyl-CoA synthetase